MTKSTSSSPSSSSKKKGKRRSSTWQGVMESSASTGLRVFLVVVEGAGYTLPMGEAVAVVVEKVRGMERAKRVTRELSNRLIAVIRRNQGTILQMEENQSNDKSLYKPMQVYLEEYVNLLGQLYVLCEAWQHLDCISQCCFSRSYLSQMEELTEELDSLKADLILANVVKVDAEVRINAQETQTAIAAADTSAQLRHEETHHALEQAAESRKQTQAHVLEVKRLVEAGVSTNAATLTITDSWDRIVRFDWDSKAKGTVSDAGRGVAVGLVNQQDAGPQKLVLHFYDAEEQYDYRVAQRGGGIWAQKPTWSMAMTVADVQKVKDALAEDGVTTDVLIHKEPLLREDERWYAQASWVPHDRDRTMGLRLAVKAGQETEPTVHYTLFTLQGEQFRKIGEPSAETKIPQDAHQGLVNLYLAAKQAHSPLPAETYQGPEPMKFPDVATPIQTHYEPNGPLELEIEARGGTTHHEQSRRFKKNLHQYLTSGKITIYNSSSTDAIHIRKVFTEVKEGDSDEFTLCEVDPDEYMAQATFLGRYRGSYMNWGRRHPDVEWQPEGHTPSLEIPARGSAEVVVRALYVKKGSRAYLGHPLDMRLHQDIANPVTVRATFVQDDGAKTSICWDYANDVLTSRAFSNYEEYLAMPSSDDEDTPAWKANQVDGVGDDYQCDLWLHVDNPETMERSYVVVTTAKQNPDKWIIRAQTTTDGFPRSCTYVNPSTTLKRIVYDAVRNNTPVVDQSSSWSQTAQDCRLRLLVDLEREVAYALEAEISLNDGAIVKKKTMYLDLDRVREQTETP